MVLGKWNFCLAGKVQGLVLYLLLRFISVNICLLLLLSLLLLLFSSSSSSSLAPSLASLSIVSEETSSCPLTVYAPSRLT